MLPEPYRLHHRADFSRTVRRGQRIGRRDLVVHAFVHSYDWARTDATGDELADAAISRDPVTAGSLGPGGGPPVAEPVSPGTRSGAGGLVIPDDGASSFFNMGGHTINQVNNKYQSDHKRM